MTSKITLVDPVVGVSPGGPGGWGDTLNTNFNNISNAIGATQYINVAAGDVVLTPTQASNCNITVTGANQNRSIYLPQGVIGSWNILNATSYTLTVYADNGSGSPGGLGVTIGQGFPQTVFCDNGTNVFPTSLGLIAGTIISFGGGGVPPGYLLCDGSPYSRTAYPVLFSSIGTIWGAGDGSTTFNVPNLQGMFLRGVGTNSAYPTAIGPSGVGQYQADKLLAHTHTDAGHVHAYRRTFSGGGSAAAGSGGQTPQFETANTDVGAANIQSTGSPDSNPKNFGVFYCIKY